MPLKSDLTLDPSLFSRERVPQKTKEFNEGLIKISKDAPKWWEVGAAKYRKMRANGETPLPAPVVVESAKNITLPSREPGRSIPCRVFRPENTKAVGVFYHIHGGGWVLQNEGAQDPMLDNLSNATGLIVISVGYRLAPEHPYPRPNEDCYDIGEYLVDNAERDYGVPLFFMGGESAGGHLTAVTCLHLLSSRPDFAFKAIILHYGVFDSSGFLPAVHHFDMELVLSHAIMNKFVEAYCPDTTEAQRRDPQISPLYANLFAVKCPPALFTVGTLDPLLDDSVVMATKWMMSGSESVLKVYPGCPHGFTLFPLNTKAEGVKQCFDDTVTFLKDKIGSSS